MTLLYYTLQCLEENGKTLADVQWIGNNNFCIEISDFITHSQNLELDDCKVNGVSLETLPTDLYIVGNDFWLARHSQLPSLFSLRQMLYSNFSPFRQLYLSRCLSFRVWLSASSHLSGAEPRSAEKERAK